MSLHPLVGRGPSAVRLHPGDILLFSGRSPLSLAIRSKTWSLYSHAELYVGLAMEIPTLIAEGWTLDTPVVVTAKRHSVIAKGVRRLFRRAPRRSDGVDYYPFEAAHLALVCRPLQRWQRPAALARFEAELRHQSYDTFGLLSTFYACRYGGPDNDKGFCSETTARVLRFGAVEPFTAHVDARQVAPAAYEYSSELTPLDPWGHAERAA